MPYIIGPLAEGWECRTQNECRVNAPLNALDSIGVLTVEIKSVCRISVFLLLFLVTIAKGYACYRLFSVKRIVTLFLRKFVRKLII